MVDQHFEPSRLSSRRLVDGADGQLSCARFWHDMGKVVVAAFLMGRDRLGLESRARGTPKIRRGEAQVEAGVYSILEIVRAFAWLRLQVETNAPVALRHFLAMTLRQALVALALQVDELK